MNEKLVCFLDKIATYAVYYTEFTYITLLLLSFANFFKQSGAQKLRMGKWRIEQVFANSLYGQNR